MYKCTACLEGSRLHRQNFPSTPAAASRKTNNFHNLSLQMGMRLGTRK